MQLARFRTFRDELAGDTSISAITISVNVFRHSEGSWVDSAEAIVDEPALVAELKARKSTGTYGRGRHSRQAYFPVESLDAVVVAVFGSPPRSRTQATFSRLVEKALQHANDAFSATHDALTGLLNRQAFEKHLQSALPTLKSVPTVQLATADALQSTSTVSVLALDLDSFKQVNDTYGHLHGDLVLQCFARRLEYSAAESVRRFPGRARIELARTGGEEFSVLITGATSTSEIDEISEDLRQAIAKDPLPTDSKWARLSIGTKGLQLPHISERRVTVSIGVTSAVSSGDVREPAQTALQLRAQADAALYRAKAGGRNVVRHFEDILTKHGQVLEHHPDTDVVAIDLGRQVGVSVGQEFTVFHPDFTGERPFVYSDGRTSKRLGGYPRHSCGRIVVFDVHQEISFCRIAERKALTPFPRGSALEIVPVGAIAHLISGDSPPGRAGIPNLTTMETIPGLIKKLADAGTSVAAVVMTLRDVARLSEARGTAFINQSLANLYATLIELLPMPPVISQVQPTQFAIVLSDMPRDAVGELAMNIMGAAERRCSRLATFRAGAFEASEMGPPIPGDASQTECDKRS